MAKKNKRSAHDSSILFVDEIKSVEASSTSIGDITANTTQETTQPEKSKRFWSEWGTGGRVGAIAVCLFLAVGVFGAGMKYLEDSAKRETAQSNSSDKKNRGSFLSAINPFTPPPTPTPTPLPLSKEYIYAGSRLLAVEDAAASAVPPADLAVWRVAKNGTATWYVMGGQGSTQTSYQWGAGTDQTVPGDYDGDGKTDFSIWQTTTGAWHITQSSDQSAITYTFGIIGDRPIPADYDGDGRTDATVFRSSNGTWYIKKSSDSVLISQTFGLSTDTPAAADYDGDGKADIAVWRSSNCTLYILQSSDAAVKSQTIALASSSDKPVSADYDGDGKADFALLTTGNTWRISRSSDSTTQTVSWGASGDIPVQNDYDGDGKVDIAVWRPSNGNWYIRQSSKEGQSASVQLRQEAWGQAGDVPVPAFYRR